MNRTHFGDIRIFVEVAQRGGFRAAAKQLNQAPASISEAIQRFEDQLGVRLFERSTRSVTLTDIGRTLYEKSLPAVSDLEGALSEIDEEKNQITGTLKLTAPYSAGPFFLDELVSNFAETYQDVSVRLIYDDQKVDLLTSGVDAAIRSNTLLALDTHAVPVGPDLHMTVAGSPSYIEQKGAPKKPQDILNHDCICYAFGLSGQLAPWVFKGRDGTFTIQPEPKVIANDMRSLLYYARNGLGLAYVYAELAAKDIASGELVEVLAKDVSTFPRYSLNYSSKRNMTRRLRAFIDMAKGTQT